MRVSLKSKLTALISFLVMLVVLATSTLYITSLTRQNLAEIRDRGKYVANEVYNQARTVLAKSKMPPGANPDDPEELRHFVQQTLSTDPGLASLMDSAIGYSPTIYYVAVTDGSLNTLLSSNPDETGGQFSPAKPYDNLMRASIYHQLSVIYGPPQVYEVTLPMDMGGKPLGDIRVGASTLFLRDQITPELKRALSVSGLAILLATITAGILSFGLLRPLQTISQSLDRMSRGEYTKELRLKRQDEWGILSSKLDLLGERMQGEKAAFNALQENLDHLFSKLTDGLMLFDKYDRLVVVTPVVGRFLNHSTEEMVHRNASELFTTDHPLDSYLKEAFHSRQSQPWHEMELPIEGETQRIEVSIQFVQEAGESVASLVTLRDSSSRAQLEDQLDVAAKLAAISRLTSGVAHEVKNPLNAMILALEILKTKLQNNTELVKPQLDILTEEIRRLDRVVKTFLDFTRPVELRLSSTDLHNLVTEVFSLAEPQARRSNIRLALLTNGKPPVVRVDRDLVKQALLNLVLNGCQAMPNGGELTVTPRATAQHVTLDIADHGVGIPSEVRDKIFSLYFTTKPGGTGVGLAMTSRIIQLHNGSIEFTSEMNRGTTFRITLPR